MHKKTKQQLLIEDFDKNSDQYNINSKALKLTCFMINLKCLQILKKKKQSDKHLNKLEKLYE